MNHKHINNLPETKEEYIKELILGRTIPASNIALCFYHSEIPLDKAKEYLNTYLKKSP